MIGAGRAVPARHLDRPQRNRSRFGLTRFYIDQEDLYVYETNPERPDEYRYQGRFEPMTRGRRTIAVKGEAPRKVTLQFTRHGPVLYQDAKTHRAYALRAAWLEPGMAPYFGSIDYMRARNWDQFAAAMNRWGAPGENQVYADRAGDIGWIPGGLTPIRPNWDGLTPVPGDGRYEWAGYRPRSELPSEHNPARGYVVTANENNIPLDHPAGRKASATNGATAPASGGCTRCSKDGSARPSPTRRPGRPTRFPSPPVA